MSEIKLPKNIYDQLKIKEKKIFKKKIKVTFDKGQAVIRIPTVLVEELELNEYVDCIITGNKCSNGPVVKCKFLKIKDRI